MGEPVGYFLTWTTYGTWLPGDPRGWVHKKEAGIQSNAEGLVKSARELMVEPVCWLSDKERLLVEDTIQAHCDFRGWTLKAVNCLPNHVHVVVQANTTIEAVLNQFKSWCTRKLKEHSDADRTKWWSKSGSCQYVYDETGLERVIHYVLHEQ